MGDFQHLMSPWIFEFLMDEKNYFFNCVFGIRILFLMKKSYLAYIRILLPFSYRSALLFYSPSSFKSGKSFKIF